MIQEDFQITCPLYFDCGNFIKKLKRDEVTKFDFNESNTIYKLRNYLTYYSLDSKEKTIDNDFYVSQILNMNAETFQGKKVKKETCNEFGKKIIYDTYPFPYSKPNRQYQTKMLSGSCCF